MRRLLVRGLRGTPWRYAYKVYPPGVSSAIGCERPHHRRGQRGRGEPRRPTTDPTVFTPRWLPKIRGQQKSRVQMAQLPFWQPLPYGSVAWYDSFNRRNRIEGIFG